MSVSFLAVAIPARPVITSLQENGPGRFVLQVPAPNAVPEFCVFLTQALPQSELGFAVYFGVEGNWQFLGGVDNHKPTAIIRTGWPLNPEIASKGAVMLGFAVEPVVEIAKKLETAAGDNIQKVFAKKVALNLFRFLESFNIPNFPVQALERWYAKFEEKFGMDPSFVLRTE